jgi:hypothetical protein
VKSELAGMLSAIVAGSLSGGCAKVSEGADGGGHAETTGCGGSGETCCTDATPCGPRLVCREAMCGFLDGGVDSGSDDGGGAFEAPSCAAVGDGTSHCGAGGESCCTSL